MTRGFIVLMKNGKILKIVESYGDSYLSGLGLNVLDIFEQNRFEEAFKDILPVDLEDGYNDDCEIAPISVVLGEATTDKPLKSCALTKDGLIASKNNENSYFYNYSYIYDISKDILKVYYYGNLYLTIKREDIPFYRYFIAKDELYKELSYDEKTCALSKDYIKEVKKFLKTNPTIEDIDNIVNNFKVKLFISTGKIADCWGNGSYKKVITDTNYNEVATFIVSKESWSKKWHLSIQLPFIRNTIFYGTTSNASCEKKLMEIVKNKEELLINFKTIYNLIESYRNKLYDLKNELNSKEFDVESQKVVAEFNSKFDEIIKRENFDYFKTESFKESNIKREIRELAYSLYCNIREKEEKEVS